MDLVEGTVNGRGLIARYMNNRNMTPFIVEQNLEAYRKAVWEAHDNLGVKGGVLKGDEARRAKLLADLKEKNRNPIIPSYYQFYDNYETFPVVQAIADGGNLLTEDSLKAKEAAEAWISKYRSYRDRLNLRINQGFEATMQLEELKQYDKGGAKEWKFEDFRGEKSQKVVLPAINDDGSMGQNIVDVNDFAYARELITKAKLSEKHIFSHGFLDEAGFKSEIYDLELDQAHMFRRLTALRNKLDAIPDEKISSAQQEMMDDLSELLRDSTLYPPSPAVMRAQTAEIKAEVKALRTGEKTRNKIRSQYKIKVAEDVIRQLQTSDRSVFSLYKKWIFISILGGSAGSYYTLVPAAYQNPYVGYVKAYPQNAFNNFYLEHFGVTRDIIACADEFRTWTKFEICFNDIVMKHTSTLFFKSQIIPEYDYLTDPEFIETRRKLANVFLKIQSDRRYLEFHATTKDFIEKTAIPQFADEIYLDLVRANYRLNGEDAQKIEKIVELHDIQGRTSWTDEQLSILAKDGEKALAEDLTQYFKIRETYVDHLTKFGRINSESLEEFQKLFKVPPISEEVRKKLEGDVSDVDDLKDDENVHAGRNGRSLPPGNKPLKPKKEDLLIIGDD